MCITSSYCHMVPNLLSSCSYEWVLYLRVAPCFSGGAWHMSRLPSVAGCWSFHWYVDWHEWVNLGLASWFSRSTWLLSRLPPQGVPQLKWHDAYRIAIRQCCFTQFSFGQHCIMLGDVKNTWAADESSTADQQYSAVSRLVCSCPERIWINHE